MESIENVYIYIYVSNIAQWVRVHLLLGVKDTKIMLRIDQSLWKTEDNLRTAYNKIMVEELKIKMKGIAVRNNILKLWGLWT